MNSIYLTETKDYAKILNVDFLKRKYVDENLGSEKIAAEVGCSSSAVIRYLKLHNIEVRKNGLIDLTGMKLGKLLILSRATNKGSRIYWNCLCDCGREKQTCNEYLHRIHNDNLKFLWEMPKSW